MSTETVTFTVPDDCGCCQQCPPCSHCSYAVLVVNSNNCTDDNFDLFFQGALIASLPEVDASCLCPDPTGVRGNLVYGSSLPCSVSSLWDAPGGIITHTSAALDVHTSNFGHYTVLGYCRRNGIPCRLDTAQKWGKRASAICRKRGIPIREISDGRFGFVNEYPEFVLDEVADDFATDPN